MSKLPTAKAIREAKLNLTEALAHLNVVGKTLKNPVRDMSDIRTQLVRKIVFSSGSNSDQCADFLKINLKKVSDSKIKKILADLDSRTGRNKFIDKYDIGQINKVLLGNRKSNPVTDKPRLVKVRAFGSNDGLAAIVCRDKDWDEYRTKFYVKGVYQSKADAHTDDKQDAFATAEFYCRGVRKGNPVQEDSRKIKVAKRVYAGFRLTHSKSVKEYKIDANKYDNGDDSLWLGRMVAIEYTTVRAGKSERYRHDFKPTAAPEIYSQGGRNIFNIRSIGGRFKFGKRGFVDSKGKRENTDFPDYSVLVEVGSLDAYEFTGKGGVKRVQIAVKNRPILAVTEVGDAIYTLKR